MNGPFLKGKQYEIANQLRHRAKTNVNKYEVFCTTQ